MKNMCDNEKSKKTRKNASLSSKLASYLNYRRKPKL